MNIEEAGLCAANLSSALRTYVSTRSRPIHPLSFEIDPRFSDGCPLRCPRCRPNRGWPCIQRSGSQRISRRRL